MRGLHKPACPAPIEVRQGVEVLPRWGLAQPHSNTTWHARPVAVSRAGCCEHHERLFSSQRQPSEAGGLDRDHIRPFGRASDDGVVGDGLVGVAG